MEHCEPGGLFPRSSPTLVAEEYEDRGGEPLGSHEDPVSILTVSAESHYTAAL